MWFNEFSNARGQTEIVENGRVVPDKGRGYVFTPELVAAVDVAMGLGRPLLVSGDPGCGKTELGYAVARRMGIERVHLFSTKSTSEARDLFYSYDAIGRFREAQLPYEAGAVPAEAADYIEFHALGRAILDAHRREDVAHLLRGNRAYAHPGKPSGSVVVVDEIDKASRDFPNDLLREIEDLAFRVPEMSRGPNEAVDPETPGGLPRHMRPFIVVTSNEERQLPDAFLRRCVFHEIAFPSDDVLRAIVASNLEKRMPPDFVLHDADRDGLLDLVREFRDYRLEKRPGISELIDAAMLLAHPKAEHPPLNERLRAAIGTLAKLKDDREVLAELVART